MIHITDTNGRRRTMSGTVPIGHALVPRIPITRNAVSAAVEMQQELRTVCSQWETNGRRPVKMGIRINSGTAIIGNIGSEDRMYYTAIGDTINLAARLESATKELGLEIIVSEHTYTAIRPLFRWKSAGTITVRGRSEPVRAYSVEDTNSNSNTTASPPQ